MTGEQAEECDDLLWVHERVRREIEAAESDRRMVARHEAALARLRAER